VLSEEAATKGSSMVVMVMGLGSSVAQVDLVGLEGGAGSVRHCGSDIL